MSFWLTPCVCPSDRVCATYVCTVGHIMFRIESTPSTPLTLPIEHVIIIKMYVKYDADPIDMSNNRNFTNQLELATQHDTFFAMNHNVLWFDYNKTTNIIPIVVYYIYINQ